jgi:streptogramin lyase
MGNGFQSAIHKFDRKTEKFQTWPLAKELDHANVEILFLAPNKVFSDSQNNGWFTVFGRRHIGRIDAKTGEIRLFEVPAPNGAPRRGSIDAKDRFWVALNRTDRIAMFDPKTGKFQT